MVKIANLNIYIGTKEEYRTAQNRVCIKPCQWLRDASVAVGVEEMIPFMYMLEHGLMEATSDVFREFKERYYANYQPKRGNAEYIVKRWLSK